MAQQRGVFFQAHNLTQLKSTCLMDYLNAIPPLSVILKRLQEQGYFKDIELGEYNIQEFLTETNLANNAYLQIPAAEMIKVDLKLHPSLSSNFLNCPVEFNHLKTKIERYLQMLHDVLNNSLAQRMYEDGIPEHENVSERKHALQAAKIGMLLELPKAEILALALHDIARPTVDNESYGHSNHCKEGDDITKPLGLTIEYSYLHAFAKFLLNEFCPRYEKLISPVSIISLSIQKAKFAEQSNRMQKLPADKLKKSFYQIMLMRFIDDMSKVPLILAEDPSEFTIDQVLPQMLALQMERHLLELKNTSENKVEMKKNLEAQLDTAMCLMARAKDYSKSPSLYADFATRTLTCS